MTAQERWPHRSPRVAVLGPVFLALLAVRRHPVQVLAWIAVITAVYLMRGYPYGPVFISMAAALVITVIKGHRAAAWIAMGALFVAHFVWRGSFDDKGWS